MACHFTHTMRITGLDAGQESSGSGCRYKHCRERWVDVSLRNARAAVARRAALNLKQQVEGGQERRVAVLRIRPRLGTVYC